MLLPEPATRPARIAVRSFGCEASSVKAMPLVSPTYVCG